MATIQVRVTLRLDEVSDRILKNAETVLEKGALDIEATAKALAPVDTGLLRNSIEARKSGPLSWRIESPVFYSVFQEFGTTRAPAQPYMTPASERVRPSIQAALHKVAT